MGEIQTHAVVLFREEEGLLAPGGSGLCVNENLDVRSVQVDQVDAVGIRACDEWEVLQVETW